MASRSVLGLFVTAFAVGSSSVLWLAQASVAQEAEPSDAAAPAEEAMESGSADDFDFDRAYEYEAESDADAEGAAAAEARAQSPESELASDDSIEEITVRGTKRQGNLQETPLAVSVFDMQQLDTANIQTFEDLAPSIPNFQYNEVLGSASFTIRGIQSLGGSSATAFHIDGIYQQNPYTASGISFYDLDGVEVLRGPTGTEYGRNANAGAINVLTKPPSFDFETFGDIQVGSYHERRIRGVLNVPVIDEKVAVRASGVVNRRYGYLENLASDVRSGDLDDDRTMAIRGQVRVKPVEDIDWITRATYVRDRSNGVGLKINSSSFSDDPADPNFSPHGYPFGVPLVSGLPDVYIYYNAPQPNPTDPRRIYLDDDTGNDRNFIMVNSTFAWSLDDLPGMEKAQLTVFGGYQHSDQEGRADADFSNAPSLGQPAGAFAGPYPLVGLGLTGDSAEWVAEASFEAESPLPLDWMTLEWLVGGFYFGSRTDVGTETQTSFQARFNPNDPAALSPLFFIVPTGATSGATLSDNHSESHSAAVFGNLRWGLGDEVTIFGGLRYSWDWSDRSVQTLGADAYFPEFVFPGGIDRFCVSLPIDDQNDDRWGDIVGRIGVEWQYTDEHMVYASYHSGYKPGTVELQRGAGGCSIVDQPDTQPEKINAWELGSRNRFWDDKLQANLTGFAYVWDDIQVSTLVGTNVITQNADSALAAGFELEAVVTPLMDVDISGFSIDTLLMTFNFGLTYSEFTDFDNGCLIEAPWTCSPDLGTVANPYDPQDWTGNQLPRSPLYTFTLTAQYEQDLGRYGSLMPFVRYFYSDKVYHRAANDAATIQPSYGLLDLTLTWRSSNQTVSLEGFVNNVLDEDVIAQKTLSSYLIGAPVLDSYQAPRTWGLRLGLQW